MVSDPTRPTIVLNHKAFSEHFIPPRLEGRDDEFAELRQHLACIADGQKPPHIWLHGPSGIGKTSLANAALQALSNRYGLRWQRVNCWENPTSYLVLERLCGDLRILRAEQQSTSHKLNSLVRHCDNRPFVFLLDEIDMMVPKERAALLYALANVEKIGTISISQDVRDYAFLDQRVKSRLNPVLLQVKPYEDQELIGVLKSRAELGLQVDSWSTHTLSEIAKRAKPDARLAIQLLSDSARLAQRRRSTEIAVEDIEAVSSGKTDLGKSKKLDALNQHHRMLCELIDQAQEITSQDLRQSYVTACKDKGIHSIASRTYRAYLNRLADLRLVKEEWVTKDGRTRVLRSCSTLH